MTRRHWGAARKRTALRIHGVAVHPTITDDRICELVLAHRMSLDDPGLCILCGAENGCIEPDARRLKCQSCGADQVYGVEELLNYVM